RRKKKRPDRFKTKRKTPPFRGRFFARMLKTLFAPGLFRRDRPPDLVGENFHRSRASREIFRNPSRLRRLDEGCDRRPFSHAGRERFLAGERTGRRWPNVRQGRKRRKFFVALLRRLA